MKESSDKQAIYWLLMQVMFQAKHRIYQISEQYGLTLMQSNAITMLSADRPVPMNILSTIFMCDASNVTGIADRLEKQGLIQRQDHPTDRRITMITLTSKGLDLKQKLIADVVDAETKRLEPIFADAERQTLKSMLQRIIDSPDDN
jgi:DNA-binding MarR family transcriptional regulator